LEEEENDGGEGGIPSGWLRGQLTSVIGGGVANWEDDDTSQEAFVLGRL
jgi:hypothetical protein